MDGAGISEFYERLSRQNADACPGPGCPGAPIVAGGAGAFGQMSVPRGIAAGLGVTVLGVLAAAGGGGGGGGDAGTPGTQ